MKKKRNIKDINKQVFFIVSKATKKEKTSRTEPEWNPAGEVIIKEIA